jgi:hypothetical protein
MKDELERWKIFVVYGKHKWLGSIRITIHDTKVMNKEHRKKTSKEQDYLWARNEDGTTAHE